MTAWVNYDDVMDQLHDADLVVDSIEVGRIIRRPVEGDRERRGWYILHEWVGKSGDTLLVGSFGVWYGNKNNAQQVSLKKRDLTEAERSSIKARIAVDRKREAFRRRQMAERAQRRAEKGWRKCTPEGTSEYLDRKGVKAHGVRFSPQGNLVIPIHDAMGTTHGLQVVYSDPAIKKKKGRDKDYWPTGLAKQGNFFLIGSPTWLVLVVEGYATAASLYEATGFPVAAAFDAGNLQPVCQALKKRYRQSRVLVCADDDWLGKCQSCGKFTPVATAECRHCSKEHGKINAGTDAATAAAFAVDGAWLAPEFTDRGNRRLTDFNDLHAESGLHLVRSQIEVKLKELGWQQGGSVALTPQPGETGDGGDFIFTIEAILKRYSLIYGTETVFDGRLRRIISLSSLRAAGGKALVRIWLEHPDRRIVLPEQVIFDPTVSLDDPDICNLWGGWPTTPQNGSCERTLELLEFLCSIEDNPREAYQWILNWLAYPIQHPGVKMQTAVLMHGPEGTGKNTFFGVIRLIYERYGGIFDQVQLESQFNGWASGKLFMIGNEVVTRVELYHQQGRLKNMITETEWQINEKNLPTRLEQNHCNFCFFSNRIDIAKLDPKDRRYCVVWTPPALSDEFYKDVAAEIADGGVEALHDYLLNLDLAGFHAHTKPPITRAKSDLIELGMDSVERFWRDWIEERIPVPCTPCRSEDLYEVYRYWAQKEGVPKSAPKYILLGAVGKKPDVRKGPAWYVIGLDKKQHRFIWPPGPGSVVPVEQTQTTWLGDLVEKFQTAFTDWQEESRGK